MYHYTPEAVLLFALREGFISDYQITESYIESNGLFKCHIQVREYKREQIFEDTCVHTLPWTARVNVCENICFVLSLRERITPWEPAKHPNRHNKCWKLLQEKCTEYHLNPPKLYSTSAAFLIAIPERNCYHNTKDLRKSIYKIIELLEDEIEDMGGLSHDMKD